MLIFAMSDEQTSGWWEAEKWQAAAADAVGCLSEHKWCLGSRCSKRTCLGNYNLAACAVFVIVTITVGWFNIITRNSKMCKCDLVLIDINSILFCLLKLCIECTNTSNDKFFNTCIISIFWSLYGRYKQVLSKSCVCCIILPLFLFRFLIFFCHAVS